jgi:ribosomal protein S12 methylthiotransferase accessory factor
MAATGRLQKIAGTQRTVRAEETLERVRPAARSLGVTRLANITGLDRVGIPAYSAIVPRSKHGISVFNGKGLRPIDAQAGALMEAIERETASLVRLPMIEGSLQTLRQHSAVLDPRRFKQELCEDYEESRNYFWVAGRDIISNREVLVPAHICGMVWREVPAGPFQGQVTSNGLASGNVLQEAISQALCELIERDAWTLAELGAHVLPWARRKTANPEDVEDGLDDLDIVRSIAPQDDPASELFRNAGLEPILHDITSDIGVPTVFATVADENLPGFPMVHGGLGTHPDAQVAVRRALTEVAQSRCVDIQAVREDLIAFDAASDEFKLHTRRLAGINRNRWFLGASTEHRRLEHLPSARHNDVQEDIDYLLGRLSASGIDEVIVVDLTPQGAPFAVVRMIIPALEFASITRGPLGTRALQFWKAHA